MKTHHRIFVYDVGERNLSGLPYF